MLKIRKSEERGHFDHGWLKTYHTFSFSDYYDPRFTHFKTLRVINEDFVKEAEGFDTHPHQNMEIITYILKGALEHKDSMGNGSTIKTGDVQYMSAGSGVQHSEFNPSSEEDVHLLQIWIFPNLKDEKPRYDQKHFDSDSKKNQLKLIVSSNGQNNSIAIRQDAKIYASVLESRKKINHQLPLKAGAWIQVIRGELSINGTKLKPGDGASLEADKNQTEDLKIDLETLSPEESEFLMFELY